VKTNRAKALRELVVKEFEAAYPYGLTADEAAANLGESVLAIRPRVTELYNGDYLYDTGLRRPNESGINARVLRRNFAVEAD
jgi:hypothetical protein